MYGRDRGTGASPRPPLHFSVREDYSSFWFAVVYWKKRLVRPTLSQKVTSHKMESGKNTSSDPHQKLDYLAVILWQANKNQE